MPPRHQWPRGPANNLHQAASQASVELTAAVLSTGIDIDMGNENGVTPLMISSAGGDPRVASLLLEKGANVAVVAEGGFTALHFSSQQGNLIVTKMLVQAGGGIEATDTRGFTPLHMAADRGHWQVMSVLIEAGANRDTRLPLGSTPLFSASLKGHVAAVRVLLRAGANPRLSKTLSRQEMPGPIYPLCEGYTCSPLDIAAQECHTGVVRELIQQCGIDGCGGASGGLFALRVAAQQQHVDIMKLLLDAGVADTGRALLDAIVSGREESVTFLVRQQQRKRSPAGVSGYVNVCAHDGATPLLSAVSFARSSARVVRLLIDAGADASLVVEPKNSTGGLFFKGTPLNLATSCLLSKRVQGKDATEEQLNRLEAIRRLLSRVEAVHAVSWLWTSRSSGDAPDVARTAESSTRTNSMVSAPTPPTPTPLTSMLPILRRRARRPCVLLAPLLRWVVIC